MKFVRIAALVISGFIALTAIGGAVAILTGADAFPLEWLADTPFTSYVAPALILAVAVGGSSLLAAILLARRSPRAPWGTALAGILMIGFIAVEVLILKQDPPGPTPIEVVYFALGTLLVAAGLVLRRQLPAT
jgi:peptidoglycan/LPS O-acetylase OafA/YrhL